MRNASDMSTVFKDQDKELDNNKLTNLDIITVNGNPTTDSEQSNRKYVDDSIEEGKNNKFNQSLQKYVQVSFGHDVDSLTKYDRIQLTDPSIIETIIAGGLLLPLWRIVGNKRNGCHKPATDSEYSSIEYTSKRSYLYAYKNEW